MRSSGGGEAWGSNRRERRAADDAPAAGRGQRVDAGLAAADGHAAGGHLLPRRGKARRGKLGRKAAQVRKAGGEAHEIDQVIGRGVQLDHALGRQAGVARHVFQVGAEFTSVADRDLHHAGRAGFVDRRSPCARAPELRYPRGCGTAGRNR